MTAEDAQKANGCMKGYVLENPLPEEPIDITPKSSEEKKEEKKNELWTCPSPDPRNNAAVRGGTRSWGSLVVLCLGVSAVATML